MRPHPAWIFLVLILGFGRPARPAETMATYFGHGEVYIAGVVRAIGGLAGLPPLPGLPGGAQETPSGVATGDIFVARMSADLRTVLQATYYGGVGFSNLLSLHVTEQAVFIAGTTQSLGSLPATAGAAQPTPGNHRDAFVARLSRDLRTIERSTFFGGSKEEWAFAATLTKDGFYVAGLTASRDLPHVENGAQPVIGTADSAAFVARFDLELSQVQATYLGGSQSSVAYALASWSGDIYVAGVTASADFPAVQGGVQAGFAGGGWAENFDAFVTRLDGDLTTIRQSTYLGGFGYDRCANLVASAQGVFFQGSTTAADFPFTAGGVHPQLEGTSDPVLVNLPHSLTGVVRATYLNVPGDQPLELGLLAAGHALVISGAGWPELPSTSGAVQEVPADGQDAFVAALSLSLDAFVQATHYGGQGADAVSHWLSAELDAGGKLQYLYVSGTTSSTDLAHTSAGAQSELGGASSGFVVRLPASLRE
jgi:hypothetical protein